MIRNRKYFDLTEEEIEKEAKLNICEQFAVSNLIASLKNLPKSLCVRIDDGEVSISKRITEGSCRDVATLRKKSLSF